MNDLGMRLMMNGLRIRLVVNGLGIRLSSFSQVSTGRLQYETECSNL